MKQLNWHQIFGNTHTIPDGRTVTPTDDIQTWLHCADIWDKSYTTLYEVLNDTATLSALMASDNAVDYLVRSTTWAVPISVPVMTSNTTPSGVCIASSEDNPAYYAFNGNSNNGWSTATVGTSNLGRIGYEFTEPVAIEKVSLLHGNAANFTCKVQYSDDGVNWTDVADSTFTAVKNTQADVSTSGAGSHLYWAVYYLSASATTRGSANVLQFYSASITTDSNAMTYIGQNNYAANTLLANSTWNNAICNSEYWNSVLNASVPEMTSDTTPEGQVVYSSQYSAAYAAWKAFNSSGTWGTNYINNQWCGYKFVNPICINRATITFTQGKNYRIEVSNDGNTWETIYTGITPADSSTVNIYIPNITKYLYNRLYVVDTWRNTAGFNITVSRIQFYGREDV